MYNTDSNVFYFFFCFWQKILDETLDKKLMLKKKTQIELNLGKMSIWLMNNETLLKVAGSYNSVLCVQICLRESSPK